MIRFVKGRRYSLSMIIEKEEAEEFSFFIKAKHIASRRFSYINNFNVMLSEFGVHSDDPKSAESQWTVSKRELKTLTDKTKEMFSDMNFIGYIEKQLDYDRAEGEWEYIENRGVFNL